MSRDEGQGLTFDSNNKLSHRPNIASPTTASSQTAYNTHNTATTKGYSTSSSASTAREWKKLLWLKQDFPDNYTPASFLNQLKRNSTVVNYSYWKLCNDFTLIALHLSIILAIILVFYGIYKLEWNPIIPTLISSGLTLIGFIIYIIIVKFNFNASINSSSDSVENKTKPNTPNVVALLKSSILIVLTLLTFSPVLKSLTNSTSSDSIWALSTWLSILNILFNDYSIDLKQSLSSQTNNNLSKNISLSNAIVLASRLNSNLSAFCFIVFSIQVSGLFPMFNNFTRYNNLITFHWFQTLSIIIGVYIAIYKILGLNWFLIWFFLHFLIITIGPWYFITLQKYKDELQGPWDPARPVFKSVM